MFVVLALVVASSLGMGGLMFGCDKLQFYQQSTTPNIELDDRVTPEFRAHVEAWHGARIEALNKHHGRMIPLAAANVLLSGLLVIACSRALSGRPGTHRLALQAIGVNALYAIVDYIVSSPVRQAIIDASASHPPETVPQVDQTDIASAYAWGFRILLFAQLALLGLCAYALTRPRALALYQADEQEEDA
jgi:hypothetical protein